jgi:hypothetical protein
MPLGEGDLVDEVLQIDDKCLGLNECLDVLDTLNVALVGVVVCGTDGDDSRRAWHFQLEVGVIWDDHELGVAWPSQNNMIGTSEPYHLKSEDLPPKVRWGPETNGQIDLPDGMNSSARGDVVEWLKGKCALGQFL